MTMRMVPRLLVFCLAVATEFGGASWAQARALDPIPDSDRDSRLLELQEPAWAGKATEQTDGFHGSCRKSRLTLEIADPVTAQSKPQEITIIRPESDKPVPVMILIPTIEGVGTIENAIAGDFCDLGIATIISDVNDPAAPKVMPAWDLEDKNNRYAVVAIRTIIDYATTSPLYDVNKVGLMGLSLGGVTSSLIAGIEPDRLNAIVIVVGGGNFPYILSASQNNKVGNLRQRRMEFEGYRTADQYEDKLRQTVKYDPMYFASRAKKEKLFMVMSSSDTAVPAVTQKDLFAAFGQPENTVFSVGHVQTIVSLTYFYFDYVTNFVQKRFGMTSSLRSIGNLSKHREQRRQEIPQALEQLKDL